MKIGIDISQVVYKGSGVARFTQGLIKSICANESRNDWLFFFSSLRDSLDKDIENQILSRGFKLVKYPFPPTFLALLWNNLHFVNINALIGKLDWFITSDWTEAPANCKKATVVHDLVYLRYPDTVEAKIKQTQQQRLKWVKKESQLIFADSASTKQDLIDYLQIAASKIIVNYPGVEIDRPSYKEISSIYSKFNITKPFILTVGKIEPRKNIGRLIEAFEQLKIDKYQLLVVGMEGWGDKLKSAINVSFLGYVSDQDLAALYSQCLCFVYPSLWEGFGYPIVEAMKLGAPVITSATSSLKEIAKDSALLFDPFDSTDINRALIRIIEDNNLRIQLAIKAKKQALHFSWKNYYQIMINALENEN